jgi:tetratricopeptide (TPR) repeat protein
VAIRRRIAYEMLEAGDAEGAMQFIEAGLAVNQDIDLLQDYGNYAFRAAATASQAAAAEPGAGVTPQVADLYRKAIEAYEKVFAEKGADMEVLYLRNIVTAYVQLQQHDQAISSAERYLEAHPRDASLLALYARALEHGGRIDDAVAALTRVGEADPAFPDLHLRQGVLLLNQNRLDDALPYLHRAVENGAVANDVARQVLRYVSLTGLSRENPNYAAAIVGIEAAKAFPVTPEQMRELDFYLGMALYYRGAELQDAPIPSCGPARQSLPLFQRARAALESSRAYAQGGPNANAHQQFVDGTATYITIQESVIARC